MVNPTETTTSQEGQAQIPAKGLAPSILGEAGQEGKQPEAQTSQQKVVITETPEWKDAWAKHQGKLDSQIASMSKEHKAELARIQTENESVLAKVREQERSVFIKQIEDAGGDANKAALVFDKEHELTRKEAEFQVKETELSRREKNIAASDLAKQYGLPSEAITELLDAANPIEMENKALKMQLDALRSGQVQGQKVDVGNKSAQSVDKSKMSAAERLAWAREQDRNK